MSLARRRAVVGGAGVAGLSAAVLLARRGWEVEVWEVAGAPGGLLRPRTFRGVPCDLGSHRLHPDALGDPLLRELCARVGLLRRPRRGRIVLGDQRIPYPLTPLGLARGLGLRRAASLAGGWLARPGALSAWERDRADLSGLGDVGFESFVTSRVGHAAYDGFYRPYAEKVWGLAPDRLSQTVAKARLSSSRPLGQLGRALLAPMRAAETYLYPAGGMGALIQGLLDMAQEAGVAVRLNRSLEPSVVDADAVLPTGPLRDLAPGVELPHRGLYLLYLALPVARVSDVETYYAPERRFLFGRVSEVRNYSAALGRAGEAVMCIEVPEGAHGPGLDLEGRADAVCEQLREAGVLRGAAAVARPLEARQHWLPDVYPLYERGWQPRWRAALEAATADPRVTPLGRQGLFLHTNVDHSVRMARMAVEHVVSGGVPSAWVARAGELAALRVRD